MRYLFLSVFPENVMNQFPLVNVVNNGCLRFRWFVKTKRIGYYDFKGSGSKVHKKNDLGMVTATLKKMF